MNLLIMGAPGAGKGSMSTRIVNNYEVTHVSTGDMLRAAIKEKTPVGLKAKEYMDQGQLVPDSIIHGVIVEQFSKEEMQKGFLLDGYPRTLAQAEDLELILKEVGMKIDKVIDLEIADEDLEERITGRRCCGKCGEIYHITSKPSKVEGVCDVCGGELIQRKDDTLESLQTRLKEYHKNTEPIIDFYKKKNLVGTVNANQLREEVFKDIDVILRGIE